MIICGHRATIFLSGVALLALILLMINLVHYTLYISPQLFSHRSSKRARGLYRLLGTTAYVVAYLLSLIRLPFAIIPYLTKLFIVFFLKTKFRQMWDSYTMQVIRTGGDFINFLVTASLIEIVFCSFRTEWAWQWFFITSGAEAIRLILEKGQMLFSGIWQLIPHRTIARRTISLKGSHFLIGDWFSEACHRYREYYLLSDEMRTKYLLRILKTRVTTDADTYEKLKYTRSLQIVSNDIGLRAGMVRDVPNGEIFIHARWTNDPWLLAGQILRRSPWIFDPRYLRRPFYYRTEANRLTTLFVLQHADYSPPYAWYQLGHEIKVARYDFFYRTCRRIGINVETPVQADGTFKFDQLIEWLGLRSNEDRNTSKQHPLWNDEEVIADILTKPDSEETPSALEIATQYTYPLKYVEEILLPEILKKKKAAKYQ